MTRISRNAPCPCGSGRKYKGCCERDPQARAALEHAARVRAGDLPGPESGPPGGVEMVLVEDDGLDEVSNSVVDLIQAGKLDEAARACKELQQRFPDQVDGLERMASVEEARGNRGEAAEWYDRAVAFMQARPGHYDPEMIACMADKAREMRQ